jgi:hypothetical protein
VRFIRAWRCERAVASYCGLKKARARQMDAVLLLLRRQYHPSSVYVRAYNLGDLLRTLAIPRTVVADSQREN